MMRLNINFEEEKIKAIKMFLEQKGSNIEHETENFMEQLYIKSVPKQVRDYIELSCKPNAKTLQKTPEESEKF